MKQSEYLYYFECCKVSFIRNKKAKFLDWIQAERLCFSIPSEIQTIIAQLAYEFLENIIQSIIRAYRPSQGILPSHLVDYCNEVLKASSIPEASIHSLEAIPTKSSSTQQIVETPFPLLLLPEKLVQHILGFLKVKELVPLLRACKLLHQIVQRRLGKYFQEIVNVCRDVSHVPFTKEHIIVAYWNEMLYFCEWRAYQLLLVRTIGTLLIGLVSVCNESWIRSPNFNAVVKLINRLTRTPVAEEVEIEFVQPLLSLLEQPLASSFLLKYLMISEKISFQYLVEKQSLLFYLVNLLLSTEFTNIAYATQIQLTESIIKILLRAFNVFEDPNLARFCSYQLQPSLHSFQQIANKYASNYYLFQQTMLLIQYIEKHLPK